MKVRDDGVWLACRAEMSAHGEIGEVMLDFIDQWAHAAEVIIERETTPSSTGPDPAEALRQGLAATVPVHGVVNVSALAQGLIVLMGNWVHGEGIYPHLTIFEQQMVSDMISLKQIELAQAAVVNGSAGGQG